LHSYRIEKYKRNFPDLTAQIVTSSANIYNTITIPDVTTEKTPYVSVEGGFGYAPYFNQAFNCVSANIYFSPVNKKTWYKTYKNIPYTFIKSFCINIGYMTYFGDRPVNTQSF